MKNRTLLILENREHYGKRLAAFIGRQNYSPFMTQLYLEHPIAEGKWNKADVVLMTSSLIEVYGGKIEDEKVFVLDESGQALDGKGRHVYKYQSAGVIYQRLMEFCAERKNIYVNEGRDGKNQCLCIGVYQSSNSEKNFRKVLDICGQKEEKGNWLYLNFETMAVFDHYMEGEKKEEGLSEIIYYVKQRSAHTGMRIEAMAIKGQVDYLLPAMIPMEIGELNEDDWKFCLDAICKDTKYEQIMLDFGGSMPPEIVLRLCDEWYIVGEANTWSQQRADRFIMIAEKVMAGTFTEKVKRIVY